MSIQAEKIRDGIIQRHARIHVILKGEMDPKIIVDVLRIFPLVASNVKQLIEKQLPRKIRKKDTTKARPFFGHFKSLVSVKYGAEGRAFARRMGQSGHVAKLMILHPTIEILSMIFAFAVILAQASVISGNKLS